MDLPRRKAIDDDELDELTAANDVRSSLQGPLREGASQGEDASYLGGGAPRSGRASTRAAHATPTFLILVLLHAAAC